MFRVFRLRKAHSRFLESCRNLKEGRDYWSQANGPVKWFLQLITPVPILGLHEDGKRILDALVWLESNCAAKPLSEDVIRHYHRLIWSGGDQEGGTYRKGASSVVGSLVKRPPPERVSRFMKQLDLRLNQQQTELDAGQAAVVQDETILSLAVGVHQRIAFIHPFPDGNGRIARLAMNHVMRRYGRPYVVLPPVNESSDHWNALETAHTGDFKQLMELAKRHSLRV